MNNIPMLKIGEKYKGKITGRIWIVYWNDKLNMIGLRLEDEESYSTDTLLHLFEWENMIKLKMEGNENENK